MGRLATLGFVVLVLQGESAAEPAGAPDPEPVGRTLAGVGGILAWESSRSGVLRYQHDDGNFDTSVNVWTYAAEYAMRYDLSSAGTIVWLEACFRLSAAAAVQDYVFDFVIYSDETRTIWDESNQVYDKGSRPGEVLKGPTTVRALIPYRDQTEPWRLRVRQALNRLGGS